MRSPAFGYQLTHLTREKDYDAWEGKTSTDPNALTAFTQGFLRENIKTSDPDVLRGLMPKVQQLVANYQQRHIGDASRATMDGYVTALGARGDQALENANSAGLASRRGTDYGTVFGELEAIRAEGLKTGASADKLDRGLIDTVTAKAVTARDPKLLDFLERRVPGQDYTWSNTPYGRDQKQATLDKLEAMGRRSIADDGQKRRQEHTAAKDAITRDTIGAISRDPRAPIPEELLARGEKLDPDFRVNAIRWRDTVGKGGQTTDPDELLAVTTDILNGGGLPPGLPRVVHGQAHGRCLRGRAGEGMGLPAQPGHGQEPLCGRRCEQGAGLPVTGPGSTHRHRGVPGLTGSSGGRHDGPAGVSAGLRGQGAVGLRYGR